MADTKDTAQKILAALRREVELSLASVRQKAEQGKKPHSGFAAGLMFAEAVAATAILCAESGEDFDETLAQLASGEARASVVARATQKGWTDINRQTDIARWLNMQTALHDPSPTSPDDMIDKVTQLVRQLRTLSGAPPGARLRFADDGHLFFEETP